MAGRYWLAVLVATVLFLSDGQCEPNCKGTEGHAGQAGIPGRDGKPGVKGEKGEPAKSHEPVDADVLKRLRGSIGSQGPQGPMGLKGYRGELGPAGRPGIPGPPGASGNRLNNGEKHAQQAFSAFSVKRTSRDYPSFGRVVTYQTTVIDPRRDFNSGTGHFTCSIPGFYYFTFHCVAKVSICLQIASDPPFNNLGFCDYKAANRNVDQVLSGGVVLQLRARQKVWLQSYKDQQTAADAQDNNEKQIIFSGFLLFADQQ